MHGADIQVWSSMDGRPWEMAQQSLSPFRIQAPKDLQPQNSIQNGNCVTLLTLVSVTGFQTTLIIILGFLVHWFLGV